MPTADDHTTKTLLDDLPLSQEAKRRLQDIATRSHCSEVDLIVDAVEGYLMADEREAALTRQAIAEADAGGPFARNEEVVRWLKSWGTENELDPPKTDIYL